MRIRIEFSCENAAFVDNFYGEVDNILLNIPDKIAGLLGGNPKVSPKIMDSNGNTVGSVTILEG